MRTRTNSEVRRNLPQACFGSAKAVFCQVPRITRGWSACRHSARNPATHSTGSAMIRQLTDSGPNSPSSPVAR